jgi:hypothetical protein
VKVCFPLLIVISVICMCILKVSCSVFLNWIYWARGNFSGEPGHIHIGVLCVSAVGCRAGTSIFGCFAGLGGGPVRVFSLLGLVLACVCVI